VALAVVAEVTVEYKVAPVEGVCSICAQSRRVSRVETGASKAIVPTRWTRSAAAVRSDASRWHLDCPEGGTPM
jgi:hypothetical protein